MFFLVLLGLVWNSMHHKGPNAAEPQTKSKQIFTTKDAKSTKFESIKKNESFVAFVRFVVRSYFLVYPATQHEFTKQFAQAAETLKHSSAKSTKEESIFSSIQCPNIIRSS